MKNIFIKSTIILMCGTFVSKLIGFIIRILFARIIKEFKTYLLDNQILGGVQAW